jgi:hypothetical protein
MGTLLGFALGFYLGTKAGPDGIEELAKAWQTITESEDFQALSATAKATLQGLMEQGGAGAGKLLAAVMGAAAGLAPEADGVDRVAARNGNPPAAGSQSNEVQGLVSTGAALLAQLLEQGLLGARGWI